LTITDTNGAAITDVTVGTEFQVRISARDKRNAPTDPGVVTAYLDMLYSSGYVTPKTAANAYGLAVTFPAAFDTARAASNPQAGLIDEIGASRSSAPGSQGPDLLAIVTFIASAVGQATFTADPADVPLANDVRMGSPQFTVGIGKVSYGAASINVLPDPNRSFKNASNIYDVDGDRSVTPLDALLLINELNARGPHSLVGRSVPSRGARFVDVSGDEFLNALDALLVINYLNNRARGESPVASGSTGSYDPALLNSAEDDDDSVLDLFADDVADAWN
jgi:hypothetical protein